MLPATSFSRIGGGLVMVWGGISLEGHTDRQDNGTLTAIRYRDEILGPPVRPYVGAVSPGILLKHNDAWPHAARVCRQIHPTPPGCTFWQNGLACHIIIFFRFDFRDVFAFSFL